jgi:hypothetical protein
MEMGFALGIGNDFWPTTGGGFYGEMEGCWHARLTHPSLLRLDNSLEQSVEQFLRNSAFEITPLMAQVQLNRVNYRYLSLIFSRADSPRQRSGSSYIRASGTPEENSSDECT